MRYSFKEHIEELRTNLNTLDVINGYEKCFGKIKGDIKKQKWFTDYVGLFSPVINLSISNEIREQFDIELLSQLIQSSYSSDFSIENNDIFITVDNDDGDKRERYLSELNEPQVLHLFKVYVKEQISFEFAKAIADPFEVIEILTIRNEHIRKHKGFETKYLNQKSSSIDNNLIFHYTSISSFFQILKNKKIYASDLRYLNDKSEVSHGLKVAKELIQAKLSEGTTIPKKLSLFNDALNSIVDNHFFAICFSKNGNALSQWRSYADNGRGFSIGFNKSILEKILENKYSTNSFDIEYEEIKQKLEFDKLLTTWLDHTSEVLENDTISFNEIEIGSENDGKLQMTSLLNILSMLVQKIKHVSFSEENEYRFIFNNDAVIRNMANCRSSNNFLIPYIEVDFSHNYLNPIEQIIIGPSSDVRLSEDSLKIFLKSNNYSDIEIVQCGIPYRI